MYDIEPVVCSICKKLMEFNFQAYIVGGAIRDLYRGVTPSDWDVVTDALPAQVETIFSHTFPSGKRYGTISVQINDKIVEVTTMRRDGFYSDGRRPDMVEYTTNILEDLARRDFTINAIAYDPLTDKIIDPYHGRKDLQKEVLRTVGEPQQRFFEDALRMMRMFRFAATLGFKIETKALRAITPIWLQNTSQERIRDELSKLLLGKDVLLGLTGLIKSNLLFQFIPEISLCFTKHETSRFKIGEHLLKCVEAIRPELTLRLAAFLHDLAKPLTYSSDKNGVHFYTHELIGEKLTQEILTRLRYSKDVCNKVALLVRHHMFSLSADCYDSALRRLIIRIGENNIHDLMELRRADLVASKGQMFYAYKKWAALGDRIEALLQHETVFTLKDLAVTGHDIMQILDIPPGPVIKDILHELWQSVIEKPELNTKEQLLALIQKNKLH